MDEDKNVENNEENNEENNDEREEETKDEIRDNDYVNNDEVEMLRSIEKRFTALEEKLDNVVSMIVDSGATIQDVIDEPELETEDYDEDFINIDDMDLTL